MIIGINNTQILLFVLALFVAAFVVLPIIIYYAYVCQNRSVGHWIMLLILPTLPLLLIVAAYVYASLHDDYHRLRSVASEGMTLVHAVDEYVQQHGSVAPSMSLLPIVYVPGTRNTVTFNYYTYDSGVKMRNRCLG